MTAVIDRLKELAAGAASSNGNGAGAGREAARVVMMMALLAGVDTDDDAALRAWMIDYVAERSGHPDLQRFFLTHGRMPFITDDPKPWTYKGWLLWYVQSAHFYHPQVTNRWGYWMSCMEAGKIIPVPIPQVDFCAEYDHAVRQVWDGEYSVIGKLLTGLHHAEHVGYWDDFNLFVDWLAWGLGVAPEPPRMSAAGNEFLYRNFDLAPFLLAPADSLGTYLADRKGSGWNPSGFYPTPMHVTMLMTAMVGGGGPHFGDAADGKDMRAETLLDCCVGTGRFLLAGSNHSLRLYGQDIDPLVVKICMINGALYVPWMVQPFPEEFFAGPLEPIPADFDHARHPFEWEGSRTASAGSALASRWIGGKKERDKQRARDEKDLASRPLLADQPLPERGVVPEVPELPASVYIGADPGELLVQKKGRAKRQKGEPARVDDHEQPSLFGD